jgi:SsrA-binding protein
VEREGYTLVPLAMHWVKGRAKVTLGLARGKNTRDKRDSIKDRDWQRQKGRLMRRG